MKTDQEVRNAINNLPAMKQLDRVKLFHGDCLEEMNNIPDGSVDLILTDPPYGTTACKWDSVIPFEPMWEQLNRIIKDNGVVILTGSEPFSSYLRISNIKNYKYDWVWNKINGSNFFNIKNRPFKTCENVMVFSKVSGFTFNPIRTMRSELSLKRNPEGIAVNKLDIGMSRSIEHYGANNNRRNIILARDGKKHPVDLIKFSIHEKGRYKFKHPTKKPVALMEYLVLTYTNENETVLDFTMGSGTTGVACMKTNRKFIGIEKEKKYFNLAIKRIENEREQIKLSFT